jgi:hypothetical protein
MTLRSLVVLCAAVMLLPMACSVFAQPPQTPAPARARATLSQSTFESRYAAAASAITLFHLRLDQRNYRGIYAMTDESFRSASTEAEFTATLTSLRDRLGRSTYVDELSSEVIDLAGDVEVTLLVETGFELGTLIETFVWRVTPSETVSLVSFQSR